MLGILGVWLVLVQQKPAILPFSPGNAPKIRPKGEMGEDLLKKANNFNVTS